MNHAPTSNHKVTRLGEQTAIEDYIENVAMNHLEAIDAIFSAICQLGSDSATVAKLASHGSYVAQMLSNELDCLRSKMEDARTAATATTDNTAPLPLNESPLH